MKRVCFIKDNLLLRLMLYSVTNQNTKAESATQDQGKMCN